MTVEGTAIITGGTSGIGLGIARLLIARGYAVTLWARNRERGASIADQLGRATYQYCDVASPQSVREAVKSFAHDRLSLLVNAAGILQRTPLADFQPDTIAGQIDIVLKGTILATTALAGHLARAGNGVVVNIGSVAGQQSFVGLGAYGAAKAGVAHFTRTAAQELYSSGTRVFCVCPGVVKTGLMSDAEFQALSGITPGKRLQTVEELARFVVELAQPDYPSLTGAVIDFDDGVGLFPSNRPPAPMVTAARPKDVPPPSVQTTPAAMDATLARVAKVFHETFAIAAEEVMPSTSPEDVARWDSLGNLRLIAALEKEFQCSLDVNEIMDMVDVASIVKAMKNKG
jgi:NAD(P)-dependent dehydrogenase (short-subunit alcohol dehydrogenase family)/acyl carrier protein